MVVDKEVLAEFVTLAKTLKLDSEQAQNIIDLQVKLAKKSSDDFDIQRAEWVKASKEDADYGLDNFPQSQEHAKRAMQKFGNDSLKTLLDDSGFGDHTDVFKLFVNIGRAMGEDSFVDGKGNLGDTSDKHAADVMFDDMKGIDRK